MKFFNDHKTLNILLIISVLIIMKFSSLPNPMGFVPFFDWLFAQPTGWANELFRLLENLSLAYLASYIFYIVIDYFPKKKDEKRAFAIIEGDLENLYLYMSSIIAPTLSKLNIDKDESNIVLSDLSDIRTFLNYKPVLHYKSENYINGNVQGQTESYFDFVKDYPKYGELIKGSVDKISMLPATVYLDFDFLQTISKIKSSRFVDEITRLEDDFFLKNGTPVERMSFDVNFMEFLTYHIELSKYSFKKHNYKVQLMNEDEIQKNLKNQAESIMKNPGLVEFIIAWQKHNSKECK